MSDLGPGDFCPDFALPDDAGTITDLEGLKGRPFVLFFYPKDDTSGCTAEALAFTQLHGEFRGIGVSVLGVSPDSASKHGKFRDKHALTIPLLSDEGQQLLGAFGVWVEKSMYGRRYMGVERTTVLVDGNGKIARIWPKVKVPGHAQEVLDAARGVAGAS